MVQTRLQTFQGRNWVWSFFLFFKSSFVPYKESILIYIYIYLHPKGQMSRMKFKRERVPESLHLDKNSLQIEDVGDLTGPGVQS